MTIVGVLNATPDSFSDGGRFLRSGSVLDLDALLRVAGALLGDGADVLDVGGESTRPGAAPVSTAEEIRRTRPVIEALAKRFGARLSIDTRKAEVAEAALDAGALDRERRVRPALRPRSSPRSSRAEARASCSATCAASRRRCSATSASRTSLGEVADELAASAARAVARRGRTSAIAVDPGLGFGKQLLHNLALLANLGQLRGARRLPAPRRARRARPSSAS